MISYLAASGVGRLTVIDDDVVELSNLQRQVIHATTSLDQGKVDSAASAVAALNPLVEVVALRQRFCEHNALELVGDADLVIDGSDNFATRYLVSDACEILAKPLVWGSLLRFDGQVSVFWAGHGPTYRDLFPKAPDPDTVPSCAEAGVFGALCGVIGSVMAAESVKLITGAGEPLLGRVQVYHGLDGSWQTIRLNPDPQRSPVRALGEASGAPKRSTVSTVMMDAAQLRELPRGSYRFVDIRPAQDADAQPVAEAIRLPKELIDVGEYEAAELPRNVRLVLVCDTGFRSAAAALALRSAGFPESFSVAGGIRALSSLGEFAVDESSVAERSVGEESR